MLSPSNSSESTQISRRGILLAAGVGLTASGCPVVAGSRPSSDAVRVDGTPAHRPLTNDTVAAYNGVKRKSVSVSASGTLPAIRGFIEGTVDVLVSGRPLTSDEKAEAKSNGKVVESQVAAGGAVLTTSSCQWRRSLRQTQLANTWHSDTEWATWAELANPDSAHSLPSATMPRVDTRQLVYGPREYQYSTGHGKASYYEVGAGELARVPESRSVNGGSITPIIRLLFVYASPRTGSRIAVAELMREYDEVGAKMGGGFEHYSLPMVV